MEQFIRYLYEYQQGQISRNVGFVKVERDDEQTTVHIHGKGFQLGRETELRLYIFIEEQGMPVGIFQGMITNINPAVNYRLTFTGEDTGKQENYPKIHGIIMKSEGGRYFAAVWSDRPVHVEQMQEWKEEVIPLTMTEAVAQKVAEDSAKEEMALEEIAAEDAEWREKEAVSAAIENRAEARTEWKLEEESGESERGPRIIEAKYISGGDSAKLERDMEQEEELDAYITPSARQCKKICRQDIAMLPRCEWRLANNSFLLHGCYNYHHLMLIEEGDELWLGIPGIYHSRESKAAEAFGFPKFIPMGDIDAELGSDEKESGDEFGYWCRRVRKTNNFSI